MASDDFKFTIKVPAAAASVPNICVVSFYSFTSKHPSFLQSDVSSLSPGRSEWCTKLFFRSDGDFLF